MLIKGKKLVGFEALIDSGADYSIFPSGISEILGLKLRSGRAIKAFGLGGEAIKGYIHNVEIKPIGLKSYKTSVIFSGQMPNHSLGVLGNMGFFNKFKVEFDYKKKIIEIN